MALSPKEVQGDIDGRVDEAEKAFDAKLADAIIDKNGCVMVVIRDLELNNHQRTELCKRYTRAGWKAADYTTSVENGERGGLARLVLIV